MIETNLVLVLCGPLYLLYEHGSSAKEEELFNVFEITPIAGALVLALADGSRPALEWVSTWLGEAKDYPQNVGRWRPYSPRTFDHGKGFARIVVVPYLAGCWQHYRYSIMIQRPPLLEDDDALTE